MNLQPHQRQFAHTYAGPAYPQQPPQQQNSTGIKAPDPCYNCGSPQHVAQHCREARRPIPAGSLKQAPRPQRSGFKNNAKPIVTRFAPPPNYSNSPYSQRPPFPQVGPFQPHQQSPHQRSPHRQSSQQRSQQQWQQQPQGYGPHAQTWQQQTQYVAPATAPQASAYSHHQPQAPQYNHSQQSQSLYPQQQHPYGYPPKPNWATPAHPQSTSQYSPAPQLHSQAPYVQQRNYQQYPQQQSVYSPYTPVIPQGFLQVPPAQNYHGTHGPQHQQFAQQTAASNNVPISQQQPPPLKPPPCFPNAENNANLTAKSGVIIWRPAQPTETPLASTFVETDEQRASKKPAGSQTGPPRDTHKKKCFSKYFDMKGNRINKDLAAYEPGSEMMNDPAFTSVRTGESMVAQPLDFVLPDEPEEEEEEEAVGVGESAAGSEDGLKLGSDDVDVDGTSDSTEAGDNQTPNTQKGPRKRKTKMGDTAGNADGQKAGGVLAETRKSWNWQSNVSIQASHNIVLGRRESNNNGARGRNNIGGNQGKRKSRSPLDNSRPLKHRVIDGPVTSTSPIFPIHHGLPQLPPSHHPLPPKPVVAPPPPQQFHHSNNRPQNAPNRPPNATNRRNQNHKQRNHPYARRSASPVRHMLVDNQKRERDHSQGKGRGRQQQQQQVPKTGQ